MSTAAIRCAPSPVSEMTAELKRLIEEIRERELWRFAHLQRLGIVDDRATLRRWMKLAIDPFPSPMVMSPNSIAWRADQVRAWLDRRPRGPAPQPRHREAEERRAQQLLGPPVSHDSLKRDDTGPPTAGSTAGPAAHQVEREDVGPRRTYGSRPSTGPRQ
jgi:predicted DNA-binding transcriptional regulator AlpA